MCLFRHRHLGIRLDDADDRFEDGFEVLALVRGEGAGDILPADPFWIFAICGIPHFFDNTDGFMPNTPGLAVWKSGHIGVYIGNGEVIEAMDTRYGVVKTKLQGRGWTHWLEVPGIKYD